MEESVLVRITAHDFEEKLKNTDRALQAVMKVLMERLRRSNENYLQAEMTLEALEEKVKTTVGQVSGRIPEEQQEAFRHEISPLLEKLLGTLKKYNRG